MKKLLAFLMALSMLLVTAACGGSTTAQDPSGSKTAEASSVSDASGEKIEIVFWSALSGSLGEALQQVVDNYNASQDKVFVVNEFQGNYYEIAAKIQAGLAGGDTPNVTMMSGSRVKLFGDLGAWVDCTELFPKAGINFDDFYPGFTFQLDYGEGQFGLPYNCSTPLFYYNKEMFKEAGLDPEVGPQTWDELKEFAQKLTIPGERYGYEQPMDVWFYECFICQQGLNMLNEDATDIGFNNADGAAPIYMWLDMIANGTMKAPAGQEYNSYEAARLDFSSGKAAMILGSTGDTTTLNNSCDFEVGTCFLPAGKSFGTSGGGTHLCPLVGHEEELEATLDFMRFATSPEQAGLFASLTGYIPTSPAAAESEVYQEYLATTPNGRTALEQMEYAHPIPVHTSYAQIKDEIITSELQRCIESKGEYTPEMALQAMSDRTKELLANG